MFGSGSLRASIRPAPLLRRDLTVTDRAINAHEVQPQARVSVVIPTLNEARNLPLVLPRIPADVHEVILVDGASSDDTIHVARSLLPSIKVVLEPQRGKGAALCAGFRAAEGDIIVMLDADGSTDPTEIPRFVDALLRGADFAKGTRFLGEGGSSDITALRTLGNWGFVSLVRLLFGGRYTDLCYGYNAFWASVLPVLALDGVGFEIETMMNVRALREGLRVSEVPSYERSRIHGESNLRAFRDGWRILRTILRERLSRGQSVGTWDHLRSSPAELATQSDAGRPHLVPVMDTAAASQLHLAFDVSAAVASPMPHLRPVMEVPQASDHPAGEAARPHLVTVIDTLRAGLQQSLDGDASEASEGHASLAYAVGGEN